MATPASGIWCCSRREAVRSAQDKDCFIPSLEIICLLGHTGVKCQMWSSYDSNQTAGIILRILFAFSTDPDCCGPSV